MREARIPKEGGEGVSSSPGTFLTLPGTGRGGGTSLK